MPRGSLSNSAHASPIRDADSACDARSRPACESRVQIIGSASDATARAPSVTRDSRGKTMPVCPCLTMKSVVPSTCVPMGTQPAAMASTNTRPNPSKCEGARKRVMPREQCGRVASRCLAQKVHAIRQPRVRELAFERSAVRAITRDRQPQIHAAFQNRRNPFRQQHDALVGLFETPEIDQPQWLAMPRRAGLCGEFRDGHAVRNQVHAFHVDSRPNRRGRARCADSERAVRLVK